MYLLMQTRFTPIPNRASVALVRKVLPLKGKDLGWGIMTCINKYILPKIKVTHQPLTNKIR